jgi:two-component system phosphate regulon response regulator OmpR
VARVLVAEDDRPLAELMREALAGAGHEIELAHTGREASQLLDRGSFDVAILDVLLPGISGDALADRVSLSRPGLAVLLVTGDSGAQFVRAARQQVLRKPFAPEELVHRVDRLLR